MITTTEMTNLFHKYLQELIEKNTERAVQVKCQEPEIIRFMKWLAKEGFLCQKP